MTFPVQFRLYFHGFMQCLSGPSELSGFPHRDCSTTHFLALMAFLDLGRFGNPFASVTLVTLKVVDKFGYPLETELLDHTCSWFCLLVVRSRIPYAFSFHKLEVSLGGVLPWGHLSIIPAQIWPLLNGVDLLRGVNLSNGVVATFPAQTLNITLTLLVPFLSLKLYKFFISFCTTCSF